MDGEKFPICPHCSKEINGIEWFNEEAASIRIFVCPHCRKILSIQEWLSLENSMPAMPIVPKQTEVL